MRKNDFSKKIFMIFFSLRVFEYIFFFHFDTLIKLRNHVEYTIY